MLFGPCAADPSASFLPAAGQLCAGGAGFVSAVIAAFAAGAKTAPAKMLHDVPEVDRLAVRIVTDNVVIQFVPNETRNGLTIERKSGNTVPDKPPRTMLNGEWGLSMHVHSARGAELHDTASKNGTFLNGKRIFGPTRLVAGDEIRMCDKSVVFQADTAAPLADSPLYAATLG